MVKVISWSAVVLWMALIFFFSSQVATESNELSSGITETIVEYLGKASPESEFDVGELNHLVRKNAHYFSYLVLGVLVLNALRRSGFYGRRSVVLALAVCVLYAISDEFHQLFVPGRGAQVRDVLIDSTGAFTGIMGYLFVRKVVSTKTEER